MPKLGQNNEKLSFFLSFRNQTVEKKKKIEAFRTHQNNPGLTISLSEHDTE